LIASIPIISPLFQALLNAIGWVLAWIYSVIPNYGVAIIILTVLLRLLVLPMGIKQVKSMGMMQALGPRINEIKKKYKGNNAKIQEETMKLYKEAGVSPLGGCIPLLVTFPFLIAMYAVIRPPALAPTTFNAKPAYAVSSHLPADSTLFINVLEHQDISFTPGLNMQCAARVAGTQAPVDDTKRHQVVAGEPIVREGSQVKNAAGQPVLTTATINCGSGGVAKIPYFLLLALMIASTFYQSYQLQRVSPAGSSSSQQQMMTRVMPIFFGFIGFSFQAGLVLYWTVANGLQISQQWYLLKRGHIGQEAVERRIAENRAKLAAEPDKPAKKGWMSSFMERAQDEQRRKGENPPKKRSSGPRRPPPRAPRPPGNKPRPPSGSGGSNKGGSNKGGSKGGSGSGGPGGSGAGSGSGSSGDGSGGSGSGGSGSSGSGNRGSGSGGSKNPQRRLPGAPRPKPKNPGGSDPTGGTQDG
jgi:YidC/Oxa1 family membrane protein insertase